MLFGSLGPIHLQKQDSQVQTRFKQVRFQLQGRLISLHSFFVLVEPRIRITEVEPGGHQVRLRLERRLQRLGGRSEILAIERVFGGVEKRRDVRLG